MNDELTGQLSNRSWPIPSYARTALWLQTEFESVQVEGEHGLFELTTPAPTLTLRWGAATGPALACINWSPDALDWEGQAAIGGYVDALHITRIDGVPVPVTVLSMGGQPLKQGMLPFPDAAQRHKVPYIRPDFHSGLVSSIPESVTTWLIPNDNPLVVTLQQAMIHDLRIHAWGQLAADDTAWAQHFALPLLVQAVTVFAP